MMVERGGGGGGRAVADQSHLCLDELSTSVCSSSTSSRVTQSSSVITFDVVLMLPAVRTQTSSSPVEADEPVPLSHGTELGVVVSGLQLLEQAASVVA